MKLMNKRIISLLLALVMLCGMMPGLTINAFAAEQTATNELEGKTISILGASMSTYTGISNNPDCNSTIGNNAVYYTEGRYGVYANDTWWMQAAYDLGLRLLVNNSWSGSSLLYERNGTVGAYVDRCVQLHNNEGEIPDIIAIQMGTNDFQYYKDTLGTADIDYAALITENEDGSYTYAEPTTSLEAAAIVLHKISIRYPDAEVYYLNISQRIDGTDELIRSFNAELKQVVEHFGAHIVDIYGSAITMDDFDTYIGDGRVHPNCLGMDAYTEAFKRALLTNTAYEVDTHTVSLDLNGVTADYGDDKIVVSGDAFSCTLTAEDGKELSVSVTMGGEDITDTTYENGTISIESVTDDVVITAEATVHIPQNYRWEFDGTDLACVSGGNTLTKDSGTTTDGVFSKTSYTLENEVVLMHDLPWIVEWKCEGTFLNTNGSSGARIFTSDNVNANYNARYIFKSNTNGIVAMGEKTSSGSHNYGIALGDYDIDWTALHTYRLENRIADDGGNMIYLLVDGEEIGPMNHYYIGTKDQGATSDWLSGKDFVFPYMGTDTHGFTNASIDYIQVEEAGHSHTYENGTCTGCGAAASPYLQQLPENVIGCTNLYDSLVPVKGYYTATKYDTSNGAVLSMVIPVEPGDRIAASSFGSVSENMGSVNGIRVTYLLGDEIVTSLSAGEVYSGYTSNGYLTVPDGVNAVCVPWWKPSDSNWLTLGQISKDFAVHITKPVPAQAPTCTEKGYTAGEICEICNASLGEREEIPATGHSYSGDTCTICGTVNLLAFLDGKYVSVLGDSISTFNGYSNDATVNTTIGENGPRYDAGTSDTKPGSYCLLESVNDTWWMHFANRSGMKLLVNNSWAGSQVFGGQTSDGRVIPAAYLERCVNLHDNTLENNPENAPIYPDVIFVYLGINDYNFNRGNVGTDVVDYAGLVNSDGTYVTPATFGEAYGIMLHKMCNAYPNAQIFAMTLLPENLYSVDKTAWEQHNAYIRGAAEYYDIPVVDLATNCAITWDNYSGYMIDKIHPTTAGMQLISDCIEAELVAYYEESASHTHTYTASVTAPTCTEQGYTTYTCECGDSYVDDYVDATGHSWTHGKCTACDKQITVSVLGDSISTYAGVSNSTAYNSTIGSNKVYYSAGTLDVYQEDTWWQQTLDVLGMELCVNNSWSGSAIFGTRAGTDGAYLDRCVQLHNSTTGEEPDIILVFLGTNDFSYTYDGGELGDYDLGLDAEVDFSTLIQESEDGTFTYEAPTTSAEAYAIMLHKMQQRYPNAEIYCMSLMTRRYPVYSKADVGQPTEFNAKLKEVIDTLGVNYIELEGLFASDPVDFDLYMGDKRVHPNKAGMDLMTEAVASALLGEQVEICTVSYSLDGVESNNTIANVLIGNGYNAILSATDTNSDISVTVTMGGEDVTAACYKNGEISISSVTGDIVITASVEKAPVNYRWELIDGTLVSTGDEENALTLLAGSVSDGVQNSTRYALSENVVLKHDQPWVIEWKASGDWSGMLLTSTTTSATTGMEFVFRTYNTTGLVALGYYTGSQYNNYGIPLADMELDMSQSHTYRMENRIDGSSNMVYLLIDGVEIGALNNYYIGGTNDQNAIVDWVSGQDFTFGYFGSTSHPLKNMALEYISVTECGHTYENGICTGCGAFYKCSGLTSITIPNSVTSIGDGAFYECTGLANVTIGNSVKSIGAQAFYGCTGLASIIIGNGVTAIGADAFYECSSLTDVYYMGDAADWLKIEFSDANATPMYYGKNLYFGGNLVTEVVIPDGVTGIGNYAFYNCDDLTSVTIPDGVTSIGNYAFAGCTGLTSITVPDSVTSIGEYAFKDCTGLQNIVGELIYIKTTDNPYFYLYGSTSDFRYHCDVNANTRFIGNRAFYKCKNLGVVTIPSSVISIGKNAFSGCANFTSVAVHGSTTSIGEDAFSSCAALVSFHCLADSPAATYAAENSIEAHYLQFVAEDSIAATCTAPGYRKYTCFHCIGGWTDNLAPLGHDRIAHEAKAPTYTEIGWDAYETCSRCDYSTYVEIPAANSIDLDKNGVITIGDALMLLSAVLNGEGTEVGDANGDGQYSFVDVLHILKRCI